MTVRFTDSITIGGGGGGPNPTDSFTIGIRVADTVPGATDSLSVAFSFPDTVPAVTDAASLLLVFDDIVAAVTDALLRLGIGIADTVPIANDVATFAMQLALSDTVPAVNDAVTLRFTLPDTVGLPSDARTSLGRAWLSGSAGSGVTNPGNADGPNNGTNAVISTAALGSTTETLTSNVGAGLPTNLVLPATAIYRGWFAYTETLATSSGQLLLRSTGGLFADKTMLAITANTNHAGGTFTYDLIANGVNTVALLRSCTVLHSTTDAVAGVTPAVMNVDAGCIEFTASI